MSRSFKATDPVVFVPIVLVEPREDGRFSVRFDWGGSLDSDDHPLGDVAAKALDKWVESQPTTFIIDNPSKED